MAYCVWGANDKHMAPHNSNKQFLIYILAVAAFVRIWGLWEYMPSMDEVQFLIISQAQDVSEVVSRATAEVHPPLMWIIRHFLMLYSPDIFVQRLFSVAMGLLTIYGIYRVARLALPHKSQAVAAAALMAFSPLATVASMGLRNYPLLLLACVWAMFFLLKWRKKQRDRDLFFHSVCLTIAAATHFSGFIFAAICGLAAALNVILRGPRKCILCLSGAYLPLVALVMFYYPAYFSPGGTIPMWKNFMLETGFVPRVPVTGAMAQLGYPVFAYFSPLLALVHRGEIIPEAWLATAQLLTLLGGMGLFALYAIGFLRLTGFFKELLVWAWVITLLLSVTDAFPFSPNRHSIYFLPFFLLPLAALLPAKLPVPIILTGILLLASVDFVAARQDEDFCLKRKNFNEGQTFLNEKLQPGDALVTGPMGAYFYLIYDYGKATIPYRDYGDKPYVNQTTLLAPFMAPDRPQSDWHAFHAALAQRADDALSKDGNVWFVQYGWKSRELWSLMECDSFMSATSHMFTRDGVAIFSLPMPAFRKMLHDMETWEQCYANYSPLVIGTPFRLPTFPGAQ